MIEEEEEEYMKNIYFDWRLQLLKNILYDLNQSPARKYSKDFKMLEDYIQSHNGNIWIEEWKNLNWRNTRKERMDKLMMKILWWLSIL